MSVVAAIIQARMGSTRFPGKSLYPVAGKPLIWHLIHRLKQARAVTHVCVATTTDPSDDPLAAYAAEQGAVVVRGSVDNVLERYLTAARRLEAEVVIRVTGDSPLVAPDIIDAMVERLLEADADNICGDGWPQAVIDEGYTVVSRRLLERIGVEGADDPAAREHVTYYASLHPELGRAVSFRFPVSHEFSGGRISVDTPADVALIEALYAETGVAVGELGIPQVVELLRRRPGLVAINAHVRQKGGDEVTRKALFRCDGGARLGLGHVMRCLNVARELRDRHSWGVRFAMAGEEVARRLVEQQGFGVAEVTEAGAMDALVAQWAPDVLMVDLRDDTGPEVLCDWRRSVKVLAVLDDGSDRRLAADLAFYPPVPQVAALTFAPQTQVLAGWEWLPVMRPQAPVPRTPSAVPRLLVCMGGADPADLTGRAVAILAGLDIAFKATVVVGAAYGRHEALAARLAELGPRFRLEVAVPDLVARLPAFDLALASFGTIAHELAMMAVPMVLLGLTDDHVLSASALAAAGAAMVLGVHDRVADVEVADAVSGLLADPVRRERMATAGASLIDGDGACRIAQRLAQAVLDNVSVQEKAVTS